MLKSLVPYACTTEEFGVGIEFLKSLNIPYEIEQTAPERTFSYRVGPNEFACAIISNGPLPFYFYYTIIKINI